MTERFDPENMFGSIWDFPDNLADAMNLGNEISMKHSYTNIRNVVVAGIPFGKCIAHGSRLGIP